MQARGGNIQQSEHKAPLSSGEATTNRFLSETLKRSLNKSNPSGGWSLCLHTGGSWEKAGAGFTNRYDEVLYPTQSVGL